MDAKACFILYLVFTPAVIGAWTSEEERPVRQSRRDVHYHSKRHMINREIERKRRSTTPRSKDLKKKPSGYLRPLKEDDIENDEVVSVAIGPPAVRTKYDKHPKIKPSANTSATDLVKNILFQLGREFLTHNVDENFVFGQYIGNTMKNLTKERRVQMQHEILELVLKYQRIDIPVQNAVEDKPLAKDVKVERKLNNDTEEGWPDFNNLAKIVG